MCEAIRNILSMKIVLTLLAISLSGNVYLAYKLSQIPEPLRKLMAEQERAAKKSIQSIESMSSTKIIEQKPIKFEFK